MPGNFLEISIQTPDILASLDFYRRLGFERAPVNDVWTHPYAVVSDGHIYLGLHQYAFPSPALTFVVPDLRRQLPQFEALGIQFEFCKLGDDQFNEAGFYDPDRQMITLLEARSCSPLDSHSTDCLCGYFDEYRLHVHEPQASREFWERLGLIYIGPEAVAADTVRMATGGLNIGLQRATTPGRPLIVFQHQRPDVLAEQLLRHNIPVTATPPAVGIVLTAPEGTRLLIVGNDF
jgi:catechol 2,3-dioxygenase-like lactoylglutathione lyase family enzyme